MCCHITPLSYDFSDCLRICSRRTTRNFSEVLYANVCNTVAFPFLRRNMDPFCYCLMILHYMLFRPELVLFMFISSYFCWLIYYNLYLICRKSLQVFLPDDYQRSGARLMCGAHPLRPEASLFLWKVIYRDILKEEIQSLASEFWGKYI